MRILLTANASYDPPRGGSTRSNLRWLAGLAAAGHDCHVVAPTPDSAPDRITSPSGITVHGVRDLSIRHRELGALVRSLDPDWLLVSSEDVSHVLLREAASALPGRLVYLAHTPQFFPFGPESWNSDPQAAALLAGAAGVVTIGAHMAAYVRRHLGRDAAVIHPPIYGAAPWPRYGCPDAGHVLMINPCAVKGISIFLGLARLCPGIPFAALDGWGTTPADRAALAACPNVRLLSGVPDIAEVLSASRLLLMPSLWYEGFGLIAMEAMLRGLPVVSSDSGGLLEAKSGTGYVIPVRPITRYEPVFDATLMPRAVVPDQDLAPWAEALNTLLSAPAAWQAESDRSRRAATAFVANLDPAAFEHFLSSLHPAASSTPVHRGLDALTPARRALLLKKLRQKAGRP